MMRPHHDNNNDKQLDFSVRWVFPCGHKPAGVTNVALSTVGVNVCKCCECHTNPVLFWS